MSTTYQDQRIITEFSQGTHLLIWLEAFLIDRKAQGLSPRTVEFYHLKLLNFATYCETLAISYIDQVDPNTVRRFLLYLDETGHNPGGIHAHYRAIRAFLNWWEDEIEPDDWKNPIKKVKAPRLGVEPLQPASVGVIKATWTPPSGTRAAGWISGTGSGPFAWRHCWWEHGIRTNTRSHDTSSRSRPSSCTRDICWVGSASS